MTGSGLVAALLVLLAPVAALAAESALPHPRGWIGTTEQWRQGLGVVLGLFDLGLLAVAWYSLRRSGLTPTSRGWLLVAVGLVPMMVAFLSFAHGLESSATVASCGSCHVMSPYVADLRNPQSATLAATHFKNQYIQEKQCYTCHSDYGLTGTLGAKLAGLGHVWRYTTGSYTVPIKIARPYPNLRCLGCHGASQKFQNSPSHLKELMPSMLDDTIPCLSCHGPAHPAPQQAASR
jgi:nitrate/TMAO reductase-like tetraheme cytochrome c subunit